MYNIAMSRKKASVKKAPINAFLNELVRRKKRLPSQMASDLGISHATVSRWLSGKDIPSTRSCRRLAEYSGLSLMEVLTVAGHMPELARQESDSWPEFREYAQKKYSAELDDDIITMIEDLIERKRSRGHVSKNSKLGS